ncbi:glycyl-tRNA synthetase subunit beta [Pseudomonas aeruginosa]|nr:glycyl-tRNA synthetase subunit beta [Pseudomonas aeruginosa]
MMSAKDFLVELGTEELPPKALNSLGEAFLNGIEKGLKAAGLGYSAARFYAAPRRLAVLVEQLAVQQPDRTVNLDGPPLQAAFDASGKPTQAALGFAKKCGVGLEQIDKSGPKLRFSQTIAGQPAAGLLPGIVETSLNELPIPKRMRWGRPSRRIRAPDPVAGDAVRRRKWSTAKILAQKAGRESRGHRFHNPDNVRISSPAAYLEESARRPMCLADFAERRELIAKRVAELAAEQQGSAHRAAEPARRGDRAGRVAGAAGLAPSRNVSSRSRRKP